MTITATEDAARDAAASDFQREEVDAAERSATGYSSHVDPRGLAVATDTAGRMVSELPGVVRSWKVFRDEVTLVVEPTDLVRAATWLRDEAGFAMLADLTPADWLGATTATPKRFSVNYHVLKLAAGAPRLRVQVWVDDEESVPSLIDVWPTADWHEREAWDFMGIEFTGREGLRRLIMPEDWVGHPLRKDYPMGGEPVKFTNSLREI